MFCEVFFSYKKGEKFNIVKRQIEETSEPYQIVTNDISVKEMLNDSGIKSKLLKDIVPDDGPIAEESYLEAKKLQNSYRKVFKNLLYKNIEIFSGFDYPLLRQLTILYKSKIILKNKKNTFFIFTGFFDIYFVIKKLAKELGYEMDPSIKNINGGKIMILDNDKNFASNYQKKKSREKLIHFLKSTSTNNQFDNIKGITKSGTKIFSMLIKSKMYRIKAVDNIELENLLLKKINKKIKGKNLHNVKCAFFATTSREDLYLKPWYPIFDIFQEKKTDFLFFTSDLATGLVLSKAKIPFINLFEEVKILEDGIKSSKEGLKINNEILQICNNNQTILGLNELKPYFINQVFRAIAIIVICRHIVKITNPTSIVAIADGEMLENLAIKLVEKNDTKSVSFLPGYISPQPILADWFHAKKIFVHGNDGLESLEKLGYEKSRIIITGNPKYDYVKKLDVKKSKVELENLFQVNKNKKLIVIGMGRWHKNDEIWMSNLIKFSNEHNFEIIIKIHPKYKAEAKVSDVFVNKIEKLSKKYHYTISFDAELSTLLSGADLIITEFSNLGIEAILLDKPVITVNLLKESFEYFMRFHEYDAAINVEDYTELENTVLDILISGKYLNQLKNGRKNIIERLNYLNDGNSASRIYNYLTFMNKNDEL